MVLKYRMCENVSELLHFTNLYSGNMQFNPKPNQIYEKCYQTKATDFIKDDGD